MRLRSKTHQSSRPVRKLNRLTGSRCNIPTSISEYSCSQPKISLIDIINVPVLAGALKSINSPCQVEIQDLNIPSYGSNPDPCIELCSVALMDCCHSASQAIYSPPNYETSKLSISRFEIGPIPKINLKMLLTCPKCDYACIDKSQLSVHENQAHSQTLNLSFDLGDFNQLRKKTRQQLASAADIHEQEAFTDEKQLRMKSKSQTKLFGSASFGPSDLPISTKNVAHSKKRAYEMVIKVEPIDNATEVPLHSSSTTISDVQIITGQTDKNTLENLQSVTPTTLKTRGIALESSPHKGNNNGLTDPGETTSRPLVDDTSQDNSPSNLQSQFEELTADSNLCEVDHSDAEERNELTTVNDLLPGNPPMPSHSTTHEPSGRPSKSLSKVCASVVKDSSPRKSELNPGTFDRGKELFRCKECDYAHEKVYFDVHVLHHEIDAPHKCAKCSYSATETSALLNHTAFHHQTDLDKCSQS